MNAEYNDISIKWIGENEDLKQLSQEIPQAEFQLQVLDRCLPTEFKLLNFMTQTEEHVNKLYKNPEQFPLNRNSSYMTYDPSRVILGNNSQKDKIENYINANVIDVRGYRCIATQGPLTTSIYNFWRMVDEYKCDTIFMLCVYIQKNKIKCDRYLPTSITSPKMIQGEYEIELMNSFVVTENNNLKLSKIQLRNKQKGTARIITHYHLTDWCDGDVPRKKSKKQIEFILNQFQKSLKSNGSPVVHCSAGVGRTGTFIMMGLLRLLIKTDEPLSIFNQVRKLKQQRWGMIHTLSQYQFIYQFAQKLIRLKLNQEISGFSSADDSESLEEQSPESDEKTQQTTSL